MPFTIQIDAASKRIESHFFGHVRASTLHEYYHALRNQPDCHDAVSELVDFSAVTTLDVSSDELRQFSKMTAKNTARGRCIRVAIVAPADLSFGLCRMYEMLQHQSVNSLRVARTREDAEAWLESARGGSAAEITAAHGR